MVKSAAKKVAWVGRTASMVFGLALVLALMFGVASVALAGTGVGGVFNLGVTNTVNAITTLVSGGAGVGPAGPMLRIDNNSTNSAATALELLVEPGKAPMKVNSGTKVTNLNADKVDGRDAPMWAFVKADGSIPRSSDPAITSFQTSEVGHYDIEFPRNVSQCGYQATIGGGYVGLTNAGLNVIQPKRVIVHTLNQSGEPVDKDFYLLVTC
jgi:hypothetical protein